PPPAKKRRLGKPTHKTSRSSRVFKLDSARRLLARAPRIVWRRVVCGAEHGRMCPVGATGRDGQGCLARSRCPGTPDLRFVTDPGSGSVPSGVRLYERRGGRKELSWSDCHASLALAIRSAPDLDTR